MNEIKADLLQTPQQRISKRPKQFPLANGSNNKPE